MTVGEWAATGLVVLATGGWVWLLLSLKRATEKGYGAGATVFDVLENMTKREGRD